MTLAEALRLVGSLARAFPRQELLDGTLQQYAEDLLDLDADVAEQAVADVRISARWFPTIGEIREAAAEIMVDAPSPMEAWSLAQRDARGAEPLHPLVTQARMVVGDPWYWRSTSTDQLRPAFIGAYKEVRAEAIREVVRPRRQQLAPTLAALPESRAVIERPLSARVQRRLAGFRMEQPTDAEKADAILVLAEGPSTEPITEDRLFMEATAIIDEEGR